MLQNRCVTLKVFPACWPSALQLKCGQDAVDQGDLSSPHAAPHVFLTVCLLLTLILVFCFLQQCCEETEAKTMRKCERENIVLKRVWEQREEGGTVIIHEMEQVREEGGGGGESMLLPLLQQTHVVNIYRWCMCGCSHSSPPVWGLAVIWTLPKTFTLVVFMVRLLFWPNPQLS